MLLHPRPRRGRQVDYAVNMFTFAALSVLLVSGSPRFVDATDALGLGADVIDQTVARVTFADLTGNGWPDVIVDRHRVFLNEAAAAAPFGRVFREVPQERTGLQPVDRAAVIAFADLNNDGHLDAIVAEFIDQHNPDWVDHGRRTGWHPGHGDGTFGPRIVLPTPPRPTVSIAIGDVNLDGWLDLYLGNTYRQYGGGWEGEPNDLLLSDGAGGWKRKPLPEDEREFDPATDPGGRPTFGTMIIPNPVARGDGDDAMLLELSYGRRWNRAWALDERGEWTDIAPQLGLDGDDIRHGKHPQWLRERAKTDPRFDRNDEPPFRANGNTFDAAVGDINNNGRFDLLISEITHGWAGDSSDRTRVLLHKRDARSGAARFIERDSYNLDRFPPPPDDPNAMHNWNHGDLFCALADIDHDGLLDVIISSGDYPDDQRLRFFRNTGDGVQLVEDHWGIDHDGSQQISLADITGNGRLDIIAGQTFNRFTAEQREGRSPRLRVFINEAKDLGNSLTLRLRGNGTDTNRDGIGAIVQVRLGGRTMQRYLAGPGGHAGKQHDFLIHFGLGDADVIDELTIIWPNAARDAQQFREVAPGCYELHQGGELSLRRP